MIDEEIIYILDQYEWAHDNWIKYQTQKWLEMYIESFTKWLEYKLRK